MQRYINVNFNSAHRRVCEQIQVRGLFLCLYAIHSEIMLRNTHAAWQAGPD